jgi:hypothetical protein
LYKDLFPKVGGWGENKYFVQMTKEELDKEINKWFSENYLYLRREISNNICKDGMNSYTDDLLQYMVTWFLERSDEQKEQMLKDNMIENYILRGASIQLRSSTSPFYVLIRRFKMSAREGDGMPDNPDFNDAIEYNDLYNCMMQELDQMHFYYRTLIQDKWIEGLTLVQMRNKYNITLSSLSKDLKVAYAIIREKCNCELE